MTRSMPLADKKSGPDLDYLKNKNRQRLINPPRPEPAYQWSDNDEKCKMDLYQMRKS